MDSAAYKSSFASLRETMEHCSEIVSEAYSKPIEVLEMYTGELPPGHRSTDRRQRYWVTEREGDMFVALPGTTHPLDWSSNLRVHYKPIDGTDVPVDQLESVPCSHAGFYYRAETVPTLELLQRAADRGCRLVLTGHSLGGAVANMCALTALTAQQHAHVAAQARAAKAAAAAQQKSSKRSKRKSKYRPDGRTVASAAANKNNHSCCSSNSDVMLSPQATLVEVLCVSFASPVYANAALVKHIEDSGWEECFVNVVVPEDYCLKLFNNVLTSANPAGRTISRTTSRSSFTGSTKQLSDYDADSAAPYEVAPEPVEPADEPTVDMASSAAAAVAAVAAASADAAADGTTQASSSSSDDGSSDGAAEKPRFSYSGQQLQRPLSALAGKNGRSSRSKRQLQLSFAHPIHQTIDDGAEFSSEAAATRPYLSNLKSAQHNWADDQQLPSSPSTASLYSEEASSASSSRSWTLLAYLPGMFGRSFSSRSLSSWGSSSSGGGCRESESGMTAEAAEDVFASWGMRHAKSSVDLTQALSLSSSDGGGSLCDDLEAAAAFFTGVGGMDAAQQQMQQQHDPHLAEMRRSYSCASLATFSQAHQCASGQPAAAESKITNTLSLVSKLLPSTRSMATAGRTVVHVASSLADAAFSVPLDVLEVGLVKALKPPMYQPVGQQWILSATGLVPQHQDIIQYPRYVHDVYWHKELMLVAFREHSIAFYKQRLLKQASRR